MPKSKIEQHHRMYTSTKFHKELPTTSQICYTSHHVYDILEKAKNQYYRCAHLLSQ